MKTLRVNKYAKKGADGDRASHSNTPYFDYELVYGDFVVKEVSGYDSWYSSVKYPAHKVENEMMAYARDFAFAFDMEVPTVTTMILEKVIIEKWVEKNA